FPQDPSQRDLLEIVSWTGIIFLVLLGGLETRLGILRRAGRAVLGGWIGGFGLPFAGGFALGMAFPRSLVPTTVSQPLFALFLAAILLGRVKRTDPGTVRSIRTVGMGLFVPFFFAYTGVKVDLTTLHGNAAMFTLLAVLVACLGKVIGGGLGARAGGLPKWEA